MRKRDIKKAATFLKEGKVVAFPTETVFGIGVVYDDEAAYKQLCSIKRRPPDKPFSMMFASIEEAMKFIEVDKRTESTIREFLPGEVTFLVHSRPDLPYQATLGTNIIGVRIPKDRDLCKMLSLVGKPCLVTSANRSGAPTLTEYEDVIAEFSSEVAFIVFGQCVSKVSTTIVDLTDPQKINKIREGSVPFSQISNYWRMQK